MTYSKRSMIKRLFTPILFIASLLCGSAATAGEKIMLVLDGSGSMWGQIQGEHKVNIARRIISELVDELDADFEVGFMAYGHRRKGDCEDIETLLPVGPIDKEGFKAAVSGINPKGKTPLSDAVRQAAGELRYTEEKATVILVSDGRETCEMDPCAMARELEKLGVDFTAHVIGFDVADPEEIGQLRCLAENTGGRFFTANNAQELSGALRQVTVEAPPPEPKAIFAAVDADSGKSVPDGIQWTFINTATEDVKVLDDQPAELEIELAPGEYEVFVASQQYSGEAKVTIQGAAGERYQVQVNLHSGPAVALEAPVRIAAGAGMEFPWRGPDAPNDLIFIAKPDMEENKYLMSNRQRHRTEQGSPALLTAPAEPGTYEIRYFSYNNGRVLARWPLEVTAHRVNLDAPRTVVAGSVIEIPWEGPNASGDLIFIAKQDMEANKYPLSNRHRHLASKGSPAVLTAPAEPGTYEIRYFSGNAGSVLAKRVLMVR